ncbi:DUF3109 family protein [Bacteroidales bacterium OttesenSCG-928-I21]|nr:DUF3109 family protein [Bacteroidales bacterium OttesenSCG-928-I21]
MIDIDNKIVHIDIFTENFCCDICKCKGICCAEGDSGAPLEENEVEKIEEILPLIYDKLTEESRNVIKNKGVSMIDIEGDLTTTICGESGPCVFTQYDNNNIAYCLIEKAWEEGLTDFRKPISCHLYPIRITKYKDFDAVNYNVWDVCDDARTLGNEKNITIFEFLKDPLIRKYGKEWYNNACVAAEYCKENKQK